MNRLLDVSSIFSLLAHRAKYCFLKKKILLCLLCTRPNYRRFTAETRLFRETGCFSGADPKTSAVNFFEFIPARNPDLVFYCVISLCFLLVSRNQPCCFQNPPSRFLSVVPATFLFLLEQFIGWVLRNNCLHTKITPKIYCLHCGILRQPNKYGGCSLLTVTNG